MIGCFALTEPGAGSDAAGMEATAVKRGDKWILNGTKTLITNAPIADTSLIMAYNDRDAGPGSGVTAFIVDRDCPGFSTGKPFDMLGFRGSPRAQGLLHQGGLPAVHLRMHGGSGRPAPLAACSILPAKCRCRPCPRHADIHKCPRYHADAPSPSQRQYAAARVPAACALHGGCRRAMLGASPGCAGSRGRNGPNHVASVRSVRAAHPGNRIAG